MVKGQFCFYPENVHKSARVSRFVTPVLTTQKSVHKPASVDRFGTLDLNKVIKNQAIPQKVSINLPFEALASLHDRRLTFQFVHCRSFQV